MTAILVVVAANTVIGQKIECAAEKERLLGLAICLVVGDFLVLVPVGEGSTIAELHPGLAAHAFDPNRGMLACFFVPFGFLNFGHRMAPE